jgi:hypothetical protein
MVTLPVVGSGGRGVGVGVDVGGDVGVDEFGELSAMSSGAGVPPPQEARASASKRGTQDRALREMDMR